MFNKFSVSSVLDVDPCRNCRQRRTTRVIVYGMRRTNRFTALGSVLLLLWKNLHTGSASSISFLPVKRRRLCKRTARESSLPILYSASSPLLIWFSQTLRELTLHVPLLTNDWPPADYSPVQCDICARPVLQRSLLYRQQRNSIRSCNGRHLSK